MWAARHIAFKFSPWLSGFLSSTIQSPRPVHGYIVSTDTRFSFVLVLSYSLFTLRYIARVATISYSRARIRDLSRRFRNTVHQEYRGRENERRELKRERKGRRYEKKRQKVEKLTGITLHGIIRFLAGDHVVLEDALRRGLNDTHILASSPSVYTVYTL